MYNVDTKKVWKKLFVLDVLFIFVRIFFKISQNTSLNTFDIKYK